MTLWTLRAAALAGTLTLAACGSSAPTPDGGAPFVTPTQTPSAERRGIERLLASGIHARWMLSDDGGEMAGSGTTLETMTCEGSYCRREDDTMTTAADLLDFGPGADDAQTGTRGGFRTATGQSTFSVAESVTGATVTAEPKATGWGVWGEYGSALLVLSDGPLTVKVEGDTFTGTFASASAWARGNTTGTNPSGIGSAVWQGVAEVASTDTVGRLEGTATVTIADLSRPRVGVAIDVPDHSIGAPGWADMPLGNGRFATGTIGTDYLAGDFHGPEHEEAWGVFDTGTYVGAFGTKREP